jgi:hypothetical protein
MNVMLRTSGVNRQVFMLLRIAYPLISIPAFARIVGEARFGGSQFHRPNPWTSMRLGDFAMI